MLLLFRRLSLFMGRRRRGPDGGAIVTPSSAHLGGLLFQLEYLGLLRLHLLHQLVHMLLVVAPVDTCLPVACTRPLGRICPFMGL
jgi:hypothetical protein